MKIIDNNIKPAGPRSRFQRFLDRLFFYESMSGNGACPVYLERWTLFDLRKLGYAMYLHRFIGDDWASDPHDHPRRFISIGLWGWYWEDVFQRAMEPCATTLTMRYARTDCGCDTYKDNLGPCKTFELGGNGNCAYCDHSPTCHKVAELVGILLRADKNCPRCWGTGQRRVTRFAGTESYYYESVACDCTRPPSLSTPPESIRHVAPWFRTFPANHLHRVRASECGNCWTLVIVCPKSKPWGFVRDGVWIPFKEYVFGGQSRKSC